MAYATDQEAEQTPLGEVLNKVDAWALHRMPALNREILAGQCSRDALRLEFGPAVLAQLPSPGLLTPLQAQRLVVALGLAGSSLGRHHQEAAEANRRTPREAFSGLTAGPAGESFLSYFARLAQRTGTGHGDRDSYASLVRWNLPQVEVRWSGQTLATLTSVFDDGLVRSYTGAPDEIRFFGLLKASEALEAAVNRQLIPLSDGSVDLGDEEALRRIARAVLLLNALRALNHAFAVLPPERGLGVSYFMDVFRQFAVHWQPEDLPPSGAQDAEALIRDLIVGIAVPTYPEHLRRLFPALLEVEQAMLETLLDRSSLPAMALERAGLDPAGLGACSQAELRDIVGRYPVLAALYLLLTAHARVAGVHLMLSKRFLFAPQRVRDREGIGDAGVVSNRRGTTGMDESRLDQLTRARHEHVLAPLRLVPARWLESIGRPAQIEVELPAPSEIVIRFVGTTLTSEDLGLPEIVEARRPTR